MHFVRRRLVGSDGWASPLDGLGPLSCTNGVKFLKTPSFEGVATNGSVGGASHFMGWEPCPR